MTQRPNRYTDWRARLKAEIDRQTPLAHVWGRHDCVVGLAGGAVLALTGHDAVADLRGRYDSPEAAADLLAALGFGTLGDAVASRLTEIHPSRAMVGDIGVIAVEGPLSQALCLIDAGHVSVLTPSGRGVLPRRHILRAFEV
ncbi:hypothetical protein ERN12_05915 [Rhodobacteraceae bacterium]|nr:hypothetical protein ERN12_05915 [Paracoccaceae bacterium]